MHTHISLTHIYKYITRELTEHWPPQGCVRGGGWEVINGMGFLFAIAAWPNPPDEPMY